MSNVKPIPDGVSVVTPMLVCRDASAAIDFCKTTFGAEELVRRPGPDGTVAHAALKIGGAIVLIEAEWPSLANRAPQPDGSSPVVFWGDRTARIIDPSGHVWTISTRIEETLSAEREQRWSSIVKG